MDDELHAAALVEKALEDYVRLAGDNPKHRLLGRHVANDLLGGFRRQAAFGFQPLEEAFTPGPSPVPQVTLYLPGRGEIVIEAGGDLGPELRDFLGELDGAARGFAEPERDCGRSAVGILHANGAVRF